MNYDHIEIPDGMKRWHGDPEGNTPEDYDPNEPTLTAGIGLLPASGGEPFWDHNYGPANVIAYTPRRSYKLACHPGEIIRHDVLPHRNLSEKAAASILEVPIGEFRSFLDTKEPLSKELAAKIEKVFGVPSKVLLNMQTAYDLSVQYGDWENSSE